MYNQQLINQISGIETPFYFYDTELLRDTLALINTEADRYKFQVHYALKANANNRILNIIKNFGLGADCVSGNEVLKAIETDFPANKIVFAGVGKSDYEIEIALKNNIACFNCESSEEIEVIDQIAQRLNKKASIALRINPSIDAGTHKYITTGTDENKFGIHANHIDEVLLQLRQFTHIKLIGIHFHIGSQITNLEVFKNLCFKVNAIKKQIENLDFDIQHINLGGGLGVNYISPDDELIPDFKSYFELIDKNLIRKANQEVHFELGRSVVAQSGSLITKVLYTKKGINKDFVITDAGFTELIRPALYNSFHYIENTVERKETKKYDVVGPICESSDFFGKDIELSETVRGDLLIIRTAGAYGEIMQSGYNLRTPAKAYYSEDLVNKYHVA